jgi:hypothetical protein
MPVLDGTRLKFRYRQVSLHYRTDDCLKFVILFLISIILDIMKFNIYIFFENLSRNVKFV